MFPLKGSIQIWAFKDGKTILGSEKSENFYSMRVNIGHIMEAEMLETSLEREEADAGSQIRACWEG